ncbi:amidohydrolase family protein [Actinopolyspora halophila]|uniref:amidohydrolase family protein n=1 Tax=Actinopolyspora halophila TaxID=1850 RepID=UPI00037D6199|nr:amidohydrolase family protein [Actinopolyspora halophila]
MSTVRIDAHHHLWELAARDRSWIDRRRWLRSGATSRSRSSADIRPYAEVALESFGPERVIFGSDWPVCLLAAGYEQVVTLAEELTGHLTTDERNRIFARTAERVYQLDSLSAPGR